MAQQMWRGPDRRRAEGPYSGENRRRPRPAGYPVDAGVNAEEPRTEQDQTELHRSGGPDPRKQKDQTDIH